MASNSAGSLNLQGLKAIRYRKSQRGPEDRKPSNPNAPTAIGLISCLQERVRTAGNFDILIS
jgi:hypothetical protein